jgi:hypothetical protein
LSDVQKNCKRTKIRGLHSTQGVVIMLFITTLILAIMRAHTHMHVMSVAELGIEASPGPKTKRKSNY